MGASKKSGQAAILIKHPGGHSQEILRPVSAQEMMLRNPKHWVTKEGIFRSQNPVSEVVPPEAVLLQGQTFLLVPFKTMQKLMKRRGLCPSSLHDIMERPGLAIRGWYYEQHGGIPVVCCKKNCKCSCAKEKTGCQCSSAMTDCKCSCSNAKAPYVRVGAFTPVIRESQEEVSDVAGRKGKEENDVMLMQASGKASNYGTLIHKDAKIYHTHMSKETMHNNCLLGAKLPPCSSGINLGHNHKGSKCMCAQKSHELGRKVNGKGFLQRTEFGKEVKDKGFSTKQNRMAKAGKVYPSIERQQTQSTRGGDKDTTTSKGKGHSMVKSFLAACTFWSASFWKKPKLSK